MTPSVGEWSGTTTGNAGAPGSIWSVTVGVVPDGAASSMDAIDHAPPSGREPTARYSPA